MTAVVVETSEWRAAHVDHLRGSQAFVVERVAHPDGLWTRLRCPGCGASHLMDVRPESVNDASVAD